MGGGIGHGLIPVECRQGLDGRLLDHRRIGAPTIAGATPDFAVLLAGCGFPAFLNPNLTNVAGLSDLLHRDKPDMAQFVFCKSMC
jgi:hypothetical protein